MCWTLSSSLLVLAAPPPEVSVLVAAPEVALVMKSGGVWGLGLEGRKDWSLGL